MLTEWEKDIAGWYDQNANTWANQRKKQSEPSFWAEEYALFKGLQKPQGKLLEIGSGSGREAIEWIAMGYEYSGIDLSAQLIQIAEQTEPRGRYVQTSLFKMPFTPKTFNAFSSWSMLPHLPKEHIGAALEAIRRVLKLEGRGFIAMREGEGEKIELKTGRRFSYFSQEEFETILAHHGFETLLKGRKISRPDLVWLTFFVKPKMLSGF